MTPTRLERWGFAFFGQWIIQIPMQSVFLLIGWYWPGRINLSWINETAFLIASAFLGLWVIAVRRRRARRRLLAMMLATGTVDVFEVPIMDYRWARRAVKQLDNQDDSLVHSQSRGGRGWF